MFDFIHALVESSKFRAVVETHLEQLLYFLLVYMEITEDQVRKVLTYVLWRCLYGIGVPGTPYHPRQLYRGFV